MGGYDLYGNYYSKTQDALNAETAQMAEIDARHTEKELKEHEQNNAYILALLNNRLENLEHRVEEIEKSLAEIKGRIGGER